MAMNHAAVALLQVFSCKGVHLGLSVLLLDIAPCHSMSVQWVGNSRERVKG